MCGIAAIIRRDGEAVRRDRLARMASAQAHRGPDGSGYAVLDGGRVGLSHVRLSIIDLKTGDQPMRSGNVWISFNGELYDYQHHRARLEETGHRFATTSDTEVLLNLYREQGLDMVHYLNGEFAFVIWDGDRKRVVLARDRSGVKPLYYRVTSDEVLVASEAKGILALPEVERRISPAYLAGPFFGVFTKNVCPFESIDSLPAGHLMLIEGSRVREPRRWWDPPWNPDASMSQDEAVEGIRQRVESAVRRRRVADVPVCSYLSGGIDSTIVCGLLAREGEVTAFNVGFAGSVYDESAEARHIAEAFGAAFETLPLSVADLANNLSDTLYHVETPLTNPSSVGKYLLSGLVRDGGFKVALTGEGADESFAGYPYFKLEKLWRMEEAGGEEAELASKLWPEFKRIEARSEGLMWNRKSRWKSVDRIYGYASFMQVRCEEYGDLLPKLFAIDQLGIDAATQGPPALLRSGFDRDYLKTLHPLHATLELTRDQLSGYVIPTLGDRTEMAHSVEGRTPFLDCDVLSFAGTIPPDLHIDIAHLREKHILRLAFAELVPDKVRHDHKHPFLAPGWKNLEATPGGQQLVSTHLTKRALREAGIFNPGYVGLLRRIRSLTPRSMLLNRRLDVVCGMILTTQILHDRFVRNRPASDPAFEMIDRGSTAA